MVTANINRDVKLVVISVIFKSPNNRGIPMTAKVLNRFEPKTLPTAMACFPFFAAAILTINSGREVPKATPVRAIISAGISAIAEIFSIAYIVYLALK